MKQHALLLDVIMDQETQGVKTDVQAGRTMIFMCLLIKYINIFMFHIRISVMYFVSYADCV